MEATQLLASVIIPAWNEERRIPASLQQVAAFVDGQPYPVEIVVVDDGSDDATPTIVEQFARQYPFVRLIRNPHGGKGMAVKTGVAQAEGRYLIISDTDLSVPIEELPKFLPPTLASYDLAIASREAQGARRINEPYYRHLMGRVYNLLVRLVAVPGIQDTQCGFKAFRGDVARQLFRLLTIDRFAFDVELIYLALRAGYRVKEVPVRIHHAEGSTVRPLRDSLDTLRDLARIKLNDQRGLYNQ